jgi:hypothetical protein
MAESAISQEIYVACLNEHENRCFSTAMPFDALDIQQ